MTGKRYSTQEGVLLEVQEKLSNNQESVYRVHFFSFDNSKLGEGVLSEEVLGQAIKCGTIKEEKLKVTSLY